MIIIMEIKAMYFSPTKTTEKTILRIGENLSNKLNYSFVKINITPFKSRNKNYSFNKEDILILGLPVYGGRIPEILEEFISNLNGNGTLAVVVAVYGNRDYDDALLEMKNLLNDKGFNVIAAAAFIGEHSFSDKLAAGRPDKSDMDFIKVIADKIMSKIMLIKDNADLKDFKVKGSFPYKERGKLPLVSIKTTDGCSICMDCIEACPNNDIDEKSPEKTDPSKCIVCCSCVKFCRENAKYIDDEMILNLKTMLENNFMERREPELFI